MDKELIEFLLQNKDDINYLMTVEQSIKFNNDIVYAIIHNLTITTKKDTTRNADIREYAKVKGVQLWKIAERLNILDSNFSRLLRNELKDDKKAEIKEIIDELSEED